jgi:hypothetical protein
LLEEPEPTTTQASRSLIVQLKSRKRGASELDCPNRYTLQRGIDNSAWDDVDDWRIVRWPTRGLRRRRIWRTSIQVKVATVSVEKEAWASGSLSHGWCTLLKEAGDEVEILWFGDQTGEDSIVGSD